MNNQIVALAEKFRALEAQATEASNRLKELNSEWIAVEAELLEAMVEEGVKSVSIEGLGMFSMKVTPILNTTIATKVMALSYLKKTGNDSIIREDVPAQTLTAFWRTHLQELIDLRTKNGMHEVDARREAIEYLKQNAGVSSYEKRGISVRSK